ncbi:MAG: hypothetical protein R3B82_10630 [Sandaracinaceae bacterium]
MRRHRPSDRPTYRDASNPERPPFTVVTVKPGEYAEPAWLRRWLDRLARLRKRLRR